MRPVRCSLIKKINRKKRYKMKKFWTSIILSLFVSVTLFTAAHAGDTGNKRKGKFIYRKIFKECNQADASVSAKPSISPDTKTMAQWDRTFSKKDFSEFGCKAQWEALSEQDLENILAYMKSGAADSPTPAKCK
jgi:hypothetical protein